MRKYKHLKSILIISISLAVIISGWFVFWHFLASDTEPVEIIADTESNPQAGSSEQYEQQARSSGQDEQQADQHLAQQTGEHDKAPVLPDRAAVKGIYVSGYRAGADVYFNELLALCINSEINAMVIDVKNDLGDITFKNYIPAADEAGVSKNYIPDIDRLIEALNENDILPIARVVAFKDNTYHAVKPDLYIQDGDSVWRDNSSIKSAWLNPYNKESWDYLLDICKGAIDAGFREIQFDYIRFDTAARLADAEFGDTGGKTRTEIITEFTEYATARIHEWGALVSADVYGTIITSDIDSQTVGQDYKALASILDFICPMIYPSHYAEYSFGQEYPDHAPYEVIYGALEKSNEMLRDIEDAAVVRPWLQGFTANYLQDHIPYTPEQIKKQISATYDTGHDEWLIWNAASKYDIDSFRP